MDPFTVFKYRDQKQQSKVLIDVGKKPKWEGCEFEFEIVDEMDQIEMTVFDEDVTCDDLVGATFLQVGNLIINNGVDQWFEIYYNQKSAGQVHLVTKWAANQAKLIVLEEQKEARQSKLIQKPQATLPS